jgi:hypothetical protein
LAMNLLNSTARLPYLTAYDGLHGIVGFGCVFHTLNRNYEAISSKILPLGRKINDFFCSSLAYSYIFRKIAKTLRNLTITITYNALL